jgi:aminoglycoside phosphotransferase (APT) family kinase protein
LAVSGRSGARTGVRASRELRGQVGRALAERFGEERAVVDLALRANPYRSGFAIHDLDLRLDDGTTLELLVKNLSWHALKRSERDGRPAFLFDPLREIETYRRILVAAQLEAPAYYGCIIDPERDRYLLLMERVAGLQLADRGEFDIWEETARRLAAMHERLAAVHASIAPEAVDHLLRYDYDFYRLWLRRAQELAEDEPIDPRERERLAHLFSRYEVVVEHLLEVAPTIVHGEFYSFNVLIDEDGSELRVCPIDWEMAAVAPPFIDVAGLISGSWTPDEQDALATAYYRAAHGRAGSSREFFEALDWCRLHIAVQWMGWSRRPLRRRRWRHWVREALAVAERLDL